MLKLGNVATPFAAGLAALALQKVMRDEHLPGTLVIWPGVAEELVGGKAHFVRAGVFKDVDICLFAHVADTMSVRWGEPTDSTGLVSVEYTFTGESAHAAMAPWRGRSAADAVELMDVGWNFRREHLPLSQRSHSVIVDGGAQPNVVPPTASNWYYFRQTTYDGIMELWKTGDEIEAIAAAAVTVPGVEYVGLVRGVHLSGEQLLVDVKVKFADHLMARDVAALTDDIERAIRAVVPTAGMLFVESWLEDDSGPDATG